MKFGGAILWVLAYLGAVLVGLGLWVRRVFGVITIDQLVLNLDGAGAADSGLIWGAVLTGVVLPVLIVTAGMLVRLLVKQLLDDRGIKPNPRLIRGGAIGLVAVLMFGGATTAAQAVSFGAFVESSVREATGAPDLGNYYVAPRVSQDRDAAQARPNLVLIYLESIENTLADEDLFEFNMLEPVQRATDGWTEIPDLRQYDGGGWTMAGVVSTQCGVPLRTASNSSDRGKLNELDDQVAYLPGAVCLGDVLEHAGYRNVYMGGAHTSFAGKGAYFAQHGYGEVTGRQQWVEAGEHEIRTDWGLSDRRLFEQAKQRIDELHASDQPFNLTLLSLDTHESPWRYDYCTDSAAEEMAAITRCSMEQVAGFIEHMRVEGMLDDTVVVVMGDHLKQVASWASFDEQLASAEDRSLFGRVWSPTPVTFERRDFDQFSMYPTLLELLGFEPENHRAGVGVSALVPGDGAHARGTMLELGEREYDAVVRSRSTQLFADIWQGREPE